MKKPLIITLGSLATLLVISWLFLWPAMVKYQIEKGIKSANNENQLSINIEKVSYTWPWQPILVTGLQANLKDCLDQSNQIDFHGEEVAIVDLAIWEYLLHQRLSFRRIQINKWRVDIETGQQPNTIDVKCLLENKGDALSLRLEQFILSSGQIQYKGPGQSADKNNRQLIAKAYIDLYGSGIKIPSGGPWTYDHALLKVSDLEYNTDNNLDQLKIAQINLDTRNKNLSVDSMAYRTQYPPEKVSTITGLQTHWYNISIPKALCRGLNLDSLLFGNSLSFHRFNIDSAYISVYYDKRPEGRIEKFKKLPHQWLQSAPIAVYFDSASIIKELNIYYQEHVKEWDTAGEISFTNTQVLIAPFNSRKDKFLTLKTSGLFLNNSNLKSEILIPSKDSTYYVKGALGPLTLTRLNPMIALVTDTHIADGESQNLSFEFSHDHLRSTGSLNWQYSNLAVAINEQKDKSNIARKVGGFLINNFVIKNENLSGDDFRPGVIEFKRDTTRSIFNYWWKSIASGLESSIR